MTNAVAVTLAVTLDMVSSLPCWDGVPFGIVDTLSDALTVVRMRGLDNLCVDVFGDVNVSVGAGMAARSICFMPAPLDNFNFLVAPTSGSTTASGHDHVLQACMPSYHECSKLPEPGLPQVPNQVPP